MTVNIEREKETSEYFFGSPPTFSWPHQETGYDCVGGRTFELLRSKTWLCHPLKFTKEIIVCVWPATLNLWQTQWAEGSSVFALKNPKFCSNTPMRQCLSQTQNPMFPHKFVCPKTHFIILKKIIYKKKLKYCRLESMDLKSQEQDYT